MHRAGSTRRAKAAQRTTASELAKPCGAEAQGVGPGAIGGGGKAGGGAPGTFGGGGATGWVPGADWGAPGWPDGCVLHCMLRWVSNFPVESMALQSPQVIAVIRAGSRHKPLSSEPTDAVAVG